MQRDRNCHSNHQKVMKQVTMYKIPHTHITTEAMTTAHLATGVLIALLCAKYDVVNFTRLQISKAHNQWRVTEQARKKVALKQEFCSHMNTVNCSCIINPKYEVIKLVMCGSHGFSSDVCMRNFVHGDLFHYFLMI